jgi:hypothetical protein
MKIAMGMPHTAFTGTRVQKRGMVPAKALLGFGHVRDLLLVEQRSKPPQPLGIAFDYVADIISAMSADDRLGRRMKGVDAIGQVYEQLWIEASFARDRIEQGVVGKSPHFEQPIDGFAVAANVKSGSCPDDRMHGEVKIGRGSAVEAEFCFERRAATRWRRKIEIGIANRAFQFPRSVAGKKDACRMRIDAFA